MRNDTSQHLDLAARLKDLEHFTSQRGEQQQADVIPIQETPLSRLPAPRRSRVFLRSGGGHGAFAELTLTAPRPAHD